MGLLVSSEILVSEVLNIEKNLYFREVHLKVFYVEVQ